MSYEVKCETLPNGYRVAVELDPDPCNPRKEWDNLGTLVLTDRARYAFGDDVASDEELREIAEDPRNLVLPVYIYDHSGVTINTTGFSCPWDSGMVGLIFMTKAKAAREWTCGDAEAKALRCLRSEVECLDQYLTGQVYGYRVFDPEGVEIDSCWGYFGPVEDCLESGIQSANWAQEHAANQLRRHEEARA